MALRPLIRHILIFLNNPIWCNLQKYVMIHVAPYIPRGVSSYSFFQEIRNVKIYAVQDVLYQPRGFDGVYARHGL